MPRQPPVDLLKKRLIEIHQAAEQALRELEGIEEIRAVRWRCLQCGYVKHFTKSVPVGTAEGCPKCNSKPFEPIQ